MSQEQERAYIGEVATASAIREHSQAVLAASNPDPEPVDTFAVRLANCQRALAEAKTDADREFAQTVLDHTMRMRGGKV